MVPKEHHTFRRQKGVVSESRKSQYNVVKGVQMEFVHAATNETKCAQDV